MLRPQCRKAAALILLPALFAFGLQWSLEVFHPIEEHRTDHDHQETPGSSVYDASACDLGGHDSHFCPHSKALARMVQSAAAFRSGKSHTPAAPFAVLVIDRTPSSIPERGPPIL